MRRNKPLNKKKLLAKLSELVDLYNGLKRELDSKEREIIELKAAVQVLTERNTAQEQKLSAYSNKIVQLESNQTKTVTFVSPKSKAEPKAEPETEPAKGFVVTTGEPVTTSKPEPVEKMVLTDNIVDYGSVAIGKIVQESIKYSGVVSASNNKKELLNLIMGKGEITKNEIYTITQCDSADNIKRELIDAQVDEALDYFKSVAGQV